MSLTLMICRAFADGILKLVEDDGLRMKMGNKGWNFVQDKFSYIRLTKDMRSLYRLLLKN